MKDINHAFLAKWGWFLMSNNNSLWSNIVRTKYRRGEEFINVFSIPIADWWVWKGIVQAKTFFKKVYMLKPVNISSIDIWHQPCIPFLESFKLNPIGGFINPIISMKDLITASGQCNLRILIEIQWRQYSNGSSKPKYWWSFDMDSLILFCFYSEISLLARSITPLFQCL